MRIILLVFGTRPEAIKMAPLILELQKYSHKFKVVVCVTGQHRDMLDQVLNLFHIKPDFDLDLMKSGQDLFDIMSGVIIGMKNVLIETKPDLVLVHGDTITSTAASLSAFFLKIPVGHIEAGLRTYNKFNPWPEEINRQLTGRISSFHFCPTQIGRNNLIAEGVDPSCIFITGNTVVDALFHVVSKINQNKSFHENLKNKITRAGVNPHLLSNWESRQRRMVLITGHRRENFGQGLLDICLSIRKLSNLYPTVDFLFPMHLNPNVRAAVLEVFQHDKLDNIFLVEPLEYDSFVHIMNISYLILTDSGGIQEEASSLGKPVLVLRDTTERPEALTSGSMKLIGTKESSIVKEVSRLIDDDNLYFLMSIKTNVYGDGTASQKILKSIESILKI